mmetsp:Transcript_440/g.1047  ORF Transcript_440/g.1047 Transcript_440/m.1047 type:complete len:221 (+) Transcript_440:351-1013(+)
MSTERDLSGDRSVAADRAAQEQRGQCHDCCHACRWAVLGDSCSGEVDVDVIIAERVLGRVCVGNELLEDVLEPPSGLDAIWHGLLHGQRRPSANFSWNRRRGGANAHYGLCLPIRGKDCIVDFAAEQGHCRAHALAHHLTQLPCDGQLTSALATSGFDEEKVAARGRDSQAHGDTDSEALSKIWLEDLRTDYVRQVPRVHDDPPLQRWPAISQRYLRHPF